MRISPLDWDIGTLSIDYRRSAINLRPPYQRMYEGVWTERKKRLLIDTILRGFDIPKIYFRQVDDDLDYEFEVVDGQQRIRALWDFLDGTFPLGSESSDLPIGDISGKYFDELSSEVKDQIRAFDLSIYHIQDATEDQIRDMFQRFQEGTPLNSAERRNAIASGMRDFIANTAGSELGSTPHRILERIRIDSRRFKWDELIALVTCLEIADGPTDVKAPDLTHMYKTRKNFNSNSQVAKTVRSNLNYMSDVLQNCPPEMNIKWGFVDLYLLVSRLRQEYDMRHRKANVEKFYIDFEQDRREGLRDLERLRESPCQWNKDLSNYIDAFRTGGGTRRAVEIRQKVYVHRFLKVTPDLVPKDPTRDFSSDERLVLWRNAKEKCEACDKSLTLQDMHADHKTPHAGGGETTLENGQCLCGPCNRGKQDR